MENSVNAVVTVVGHDRVGILSKVAANIADANANVLEITQSVKGGFFMMMMVIDIAEMNISITDLQNAIHGDLPDMEIHVMHQNIFDSMHRI